MDDSSSKLIDKYVQEGLSGTEKSKFQTLMQKSEFAEEVDFRQKLKKASQKGGRDELKALFNELDEELEEDEAETQSIPLRSRRFAWYPWAGVAAAVLLLFTFFLWPSPSEQELFVDHYNSFPNLIAPGDRSGGEQNLLDRALKAYEQKDYTEAVHLFEQFPEMSQDERIYYGLSLMLLEKPDEKSILELKAVADDPSARYQQAAQWYLALAYLKLENRDASKALIDEIIATQGHTYRDNALDLAKDL
ncbi:MAG: hypothetical protein R3B93_09815 [Bacteroidia bacterium]